MSRIEPVETSSNQRIKDIFEEIEKSFGMVSNVFRTYAHSEAVLDANWHKVKRVMLEGNLSRVVKETIAVAVSSDNGCDYCVTHHSMALRSLGVSAEQAEKLAGEPEDERFSARENALIALARAANGDHHAITDEQVQQVRDAGASSADIVEALAVMETFSGLNRFIDTAGVELES